MHIGAKLIHVGALQNTVSAAFIYLLTLRSTLRFLCRIVSANDQFPGNFFFFCCYFTSLVMCATAGSLHDV